MSFSHLDETGKVSMVDVSNKQDTARSARAQTKVTMSATCYNLLKAGEIEKGEVWSVVRIAGIQGAKKTADLIPLCHPLALTKIAIEFDLDDVNQTVTINSLCRLTGKTGVEMEAMTAVSVAALTLYDMCKAVDPTMVIGPTRVLSKQGGKSGDWQADDHC